MNQKRLRAVAVLAFGAAVAAAWPAGNGHVAVPNVAPRAGDVASIDGMIKAWYEVITGPAGQPRQWARDRTLYIPDMRFVSTSTEAGAVQARVSSHQAYVDASDGEMVQKGFFEKEIHRVTEQYGPIAHVWSTYETRESDNGPVTARGINSIELYWDGKRWWIANAMWADESKGQPIPPQYLPARG